MTEKKPLSVPEVKNKLSQRLVSSGTDFKQRMSELSKVKLDKAFNEVTPYAFEYEGKVWMCLCCRQETDNALFERCLRRETACGYAGAGAPSCYLCEYLAFIRCNDEPKQTVTIR
jgi:hypothetical protein